MHTSRTSGEERIATIAGITRASSSCSPTSWAPGRVDWPPMSMIEAPEEMKSKTVLMILVRSLLWRPPSEKESGVRFKMAIIIVGLLREGVVSGGREDDSGVRAERGAGGGGRAFRHDKTEALECCEGSLLCGINLIVTSVRRDFFPSIPGAKLTRIVDVGQILAQ